MRKTSSRLWTATVAILCSLPLGATELPTADEAIVNTGFTLYQTHCASCHGEDATGGAADTPHMTVGTADLTGIAARNGGAFPFWEIYEIISGTELLPAHADRTMPVWGSLLGEAPAGIDAASLARGRILAIMAYLASVQQGGETP